MKNMMRFMSFHVFLFSLLFTLYTFGDPIQCQKANIVVNKFTLDGKNLNPQIYWGPKNVLVMIAQPLGEPYLSTEGGVSWQPLRNRLPSFSPVLRAVFHSNDTKLLLIGTEGKHWISLDSGATFKEKSSSSSSGDHLPPLNTIVQQRVSSESILLLATETESCVSSSNCPATLFLSQNFGEVWEKVWTNVYQMQWTTAGTYLFTFKNPSNGTVSLARAEPEKQPLVLFNSVFTFDVVGRRPSNIFVSLNVGEDQEKTLMVSLDSGATFKTARFPTELPHYAHRVVAFEGGVAYVAAQHFTDGPSAKLVYGHLYVSDSQLTNFVTVLENVVLRVSQGEGKAASVIVSFFAVDRDVIFVANVVDNQLRQKTMRTVDRGATWSRLSLPESSFCQEEEECHLNLIGDKSESFYSSTKTPGLIVAQGNVGTFLSSPRFLFLSMNWGDTWTLLSSQLTPLFDETNFGALLLLIDPAQPTAVKYSWNGGQVFSLCSFATTEQQQQVKSLSTNPNDASSLHVFITSLANDETILYHLDFSSLHERECQGGERPGAKDSDYELWSPVDCLLGRKIVNVRKKIDAECFNAANYTTSRITSRCPCTLADYQCDFCFQRNGSECQRVCDEKPDGVGPCYTTQGYRLLENDVCSLSHSVGGLDLRPHDSCHSPLRFIIMFLIISALWSGAVLVGCYLLYIKNARFRVWAQEKIPWLPKQEEVSYSLFGNTDLSQVNVGVNLLEDNDVHNEEDI